MEGKCVFCDSPLGEKATQKLTCVGVKKINEVCTRLETNLDVKEGQFVHHYCRKTFVDERNVLRKEKEMKMIKLSTSFSPKKTRSLSTFNFNNHCFLCGRPADCQDKKLKTSKVVTSEKDFDNKIKEVCRKRKDRWATEVEGRISCISDLFAADAIYHHTCNVNFRTDKSLPHQVDSREETITKKENTTSAGRPIVPTKWEAFVSTVKHCEETCKHKEFSTMAELQEKMRTILRTNLEETEKFFESCTFDELQEKVRSLLGSKIKDVNRADVFSDVKRKARDLLLTQIEPYSIKHLKRNLIDHFSSVFSSHDMDEPRL